MPTRCNLSMVRFGSALALALALAACTKGGQFDPAEVLSADVFDTKKKLQGQREPLFPNGVPGAETGVPPELMKGYQPPPEQAASNSEPAAPAKPEPAADQPKPKPKPKPKVARAPASPAPAMPPAAHDPVWDQPAATPGARPGQVVWPAPQAAPAQQQTAQPAWPNPTAGASSH